MVNKVTISELPELVSVSGSESIPVDSYDEGQEKNKTFRLSVEVIKNFIESNLNLGETVTQEQILTWDNKETTQGAQDKADASLVLAKEYTDDELAAVNLAISNLTDLLTSDDVALDELQEIVDFIKLNRSDLNSLTTASIAGLDAALALKADVSALEDKVDSSTMTSALADKVDSATMTSALALKADVSALEDKADVSALALKADVSALALKADVSALEDKVDSATMTSALADKVDSATMTSALADKVDSSTMTSALEDKVDSSTMTSALELKADVKNSFEVVASDKTIVNADAGKILYIIEDCVLTVSDYDSLDDGFNCKIVVDTDTVTVAFTGSNTVRGDHTEILEDTTLIKTPTAGVFVFFGK